MAGRLVNWNNLELRISGSELESIAKQKALEAGAPVHGLKITFSRGKMRITGKAKAIVKIPFQVDITEIEVRGRTVVVPIDSVSAAGLPVPNLLSSLFEKSAAAGAIKVDGSGPSVTILLERFLPEFVDVDLDEIVIIEDGLLVRAGSGGADLPKGV